MAQHSIRCGVIGAGWWGTFAHIPGLRSHPNADLVAIQTADAEQGQMIARDFGIPRSYTSTAELLDGEDVAAVVVSSSPHLHYADARAALTRGKHVLLEKPMTLTVAEAKELTAIAAEHATQFLISCPWHYTSHAREAQRLVRGGALGDVRMSSVLMTNPISNLLRGVDMTPTHGAPYMHPRKGTYSDPDLAGGGQIYTQVSHVAAYLTFLTGSRPMEVFARFHNDGAAVDIYDTINMRMDDSSIVSLASTAATSRERRDFEVRVFGARGMLFLDLWRGRLEFVPMEGEPRQYPQLTDDEVYPHQEPARNLIDSIGNPMLNQAPACLGVAAMEVIEGACRSARTGRNVKIASLVEQPR